MRGAGLGARNGGENGGTSPISICRQRPAVLVSAAQWVTDSPGTIGGKGETLRERGDMEGWGRHGGMGGWGRHGGTGRGTSGWQAKSAVDSI